MTIKEDVIYSMEAYHPEGECYIVVSLLGEPIWRGVTEEQTPASVNLKIEIDIHWSDGLSGLWSWMQIIEQMLGGWMAESEHVKIQTAWESMESVMGKARRR